jgi:hypothetical protein
MTVSRHPALIIPSQLSDPCLTVWLLPLLVDQKVKLDDPTPSLHPHYETSSLLRVGPPLCPASGLSPSWVLHLGFSFNIGTTVSQVPCKSPNQTRAAFMPETPPKQQTGFPWANPGVTIAPQVLATSIVFRHLISGSLALVSLILTCQEPLP